VSIRAGSAAAATAGYQTPDQRSSRAQQSGAAASNRLGWAPRDVAVRKQPIGIVPLRRDNTWVDPRLRCKHSAGPGASIKQAIAKPGERPMSAPLFKNDILFLQRFLKVSGLYAGPLDGKFSTAVGDGEDALATRYEAIKQQFVGFDARSESCIMTLQPNAQRKAREFLTATQGLPLTYKIISGTRTYAEQDALFALGRTKPGKIVTKARGGQSNHNFGIAWDVGIFDGGKYLTGATKKEDQAYVDLGNSTLAHVNGLEWGGNWPSFPDKPHYQLATGQSVAAVRKLFEAGSAFV
jgi:peptidoglycan LD-endopeptidase CwlK